MGAVGLKKMEKLLTQLEILKTAHLDEGMKISQAYGGALYAFDLLAWAVLNRSTSLTAGFITLMRTANYLAAFTLVRPQLDNFLRFAAGWLVPDPHLFAMNILKGIPVRKQKTRDGHLMMDRYLVDHFKTEHPWIDQVYREASGFVHLSEKHMFMNIQSVDEESRTETMTISEKHDHVPQEIRHEAIMCFSEITKLVLHRAYSWRITKDNPPGPKNGEPTSGCTGSSGNPAPGEP